MVAPEAPPPRGLNWKTVALAFRLLFTTMLPPFSSIVKLDVPAAAAAAVDDDAVDDDEGVFFFAEGFSTMF